MRVLKSSVLLVLVLVFCVGSIATVRADEVDKLINQLKDKDWTVRLLAAIDLGKIGDNRAVEPLVTALKDKDWHAQGGVRKQAALSLRKITGKHFGEAPEKWQKWWEQNKEKFRNTK